MLITLIILAIFIETKTEIVKPQKEIFPTGVSALEICQAIRERAKLKNVKSFTRADQRKLPQVCKTIVEGARRWKISPFLIAGVIWSESTFRASPPPGKVCRKVLKYWKGIGPNPPGWPKTVTKCWKIGVYEKGYMQLIWWHGDPKRGYQAVTGLQPKGKRYRRGLRETRINILVGSYELAKECQRCPRRGHRHKMGWMPVKIRKFFNRNPGLWKYFCVAHFNWGGAFRPQVKWFDQWPYPMRVLSRALTLAKAVKKNRQISAIMRQNQRGKLNGNLSSTQTRNSSQRPVISQGEKQTIGQGHNHQD